MKMSFAVFVTAFVFSLIFGQGQCHISPGNANYTSFTEVCLKVPYSVDQCYKEALNQPISPRAAKIDCLQRLLWLHESEANLTPADLKYFSTLSQTNWKLGHPYPKTGFRKRQEYRTLTDNQRMRLHMAFNKLYQKGIIRKYGLLHRTAVRLHHDGASFLAWHRAFLAMFEDELRLEDNTISLPYWDIELDHNMDNPVNSILCSSELLGNCYGDVVTGPFKNWYTSRGKLWREYGSHPRGRLFGHASIKRILSRCHNEEVSFPVKMPGNEEQMEFVYEYIHNGCHNWMGGDMADVDTAAFDPIFYMLHAFIDLLWEDFRKRQTVVCGVDPEKDYPVLTGGPSHGPSAPMYGFDGLQNIDGLRNYWTDTWYAYESRPQCPNCNSKYLYCDHKRNKCVSHSRRTDYNPGQYYNKHGVVAEPFEPPVSYIPKRTSNNFEPAPLSDGRSRASAERDARMAMAAGNFGGSAYTINNHVRRDSLPASSMPYSPNAHPQYNVNNNPNLAQVFGGSDLSHRITKYNYINNPKLLPQRPPHRKFISLI